MSVMKLSQAKYVTPPFILKKIEKLAAIIHVLWNTQNLIVIARSCFTENGKKNAQSYNAHAQLSIEI